MDVVVTRQQPVASKSLPAPGMEFQARFQPANTSSVSVPCEIIYFQITQSAPRADLSS